MTPLQRVLAEKLAHDNGFEHVVTGDRQTLTVASARHPTTVTIDVAIDHAYVADVSGQSRALITELQRANDCQWVQADRFLIIGEPALASFLRRVASLSSALPNQAEDDFRRAIEQELQAMPDGVMGTEVERMVRQRVGQARFRDAMLDYWGGACAVTGVRLPDILRASHAKPWADCVSDAERLNVFNGFLLTANLDALFDRFLISFDEQGDLLTAPTLTSEVQAALGIDAHLRVRWLANEHRPFLDYHRARFRAAMA